MHNSNMPNDQLTVYLRPDSRLGTRVEAYAKAENIDVLIKDITRDKLTPTQWAQVLEASDKSAADIIDKTDPWFQEKGIEVANYDEWMSIVEKNPELIKVAVAQQGNTIKIIEDPAHLSQF